MAPLINVFVLSVFACSFGSCFAGSRKELRNKDLSQETALPLAQSIYPNSIDPSHVVQLSWRPRVFLYKGFLSDKECDYLISLSQTVKEKSSGKDSNSEGIVANKMLMSETSLNITDDIVSRIEERISVWTFLPKENSKPLQVMHYGLEKAGQNLDYFTNKSELELSGALIATVILYLSNVTEGGQILFPKSEPKSRSWSDCKKTSKIIKPVKGNAILFFSLHPSASTDSSSFHARCPILEGDMWSAIKFFYSRSVVGERASSTSDGGDCTDEDDNCPTWAAGGECQRNPVYMIGSPDYYGTCRKSCNVC